eukprot:SAG11_NODE_24058_length_378_cov_3.559140_1_plen_100_part_01
METYLAVSEARLHHALHEFLYVRKQIVWRPKETWLQGSGITSQFDIQQWIMWKRFPSFNGTRYGYGNVRVQRVRVQQVQAHRRSSGLNLRVSTGGRNVHR